MAWLACLDYRLVFLLLLAVTSLSQVLASAGSVECLALGFSELALCSQCTALAEVVKDSELEAECRKCCTDDGESDEAKKLYASAVLEVCSRRVHFFPQTLRFIEDKAEAYPRLRVRYRANSLPKLLMMDAEGEVEDTLMIDNWRSEHIEAFLAERLVNDEGSAVS
eukprot:TRINITY_DN5464_c0_g1_i1.p1 TRINITY_DN5464_c0_g1~~TRINITY_DN5464_c0_g1_i1.p1  ORF type:complete len:166 (-),score=35.32 TRINITY_DN5464_c0_g1_i1:678-1175(-)